MTRRARRGDEIRRLLDEAGHRPTPMPRAGAFEEIAGRFDLGATRPLTSVVTLGAGHGRRRGRGLPLSLLGAAGVAALFGGALAGGWSGDGSPAAQALAVATAADTTVVLPDGSSVAARRGLVLPDGTVVRTGANGRCVAGDVDLGPSLEATVNAGRLRLRSTVLASNPAPVLDVSGGDPASSAAVTSEPAATVSVAPVATAATPTPVTTPSVATTQPAYRSGSTGKSSKGNSR